MPFGSEPREQGIALAFSGGGFRAVLFDGGVLRWLNQMGVFARMRRMSRQLGVCATGSLTPHT